MTDKQLYLGRTGRNVSDAEQLDIHDQVEGDSIEVVVEAKPLYQSAGFCRVITAGKSIHQLKRAYREASSSWLSRKGNGTLNYKLSKGEIAEFESVVRSYEKGRWYIELDADGTINELTEAEIKARVHGFASVKAYQSEIERQDAERLNLAHAQGLPELEGSEKQIRWALSIREKLLKKDSLAEAAATKTSAKWFIDNRFAA
jgi:hypothetical protein